jgi:hypothetical protein
MRVLDDLINHHDSMVGIISTKAPSYDIEFPCVGYLTFLISTNFFLEAAAPDSGDFNRIVYFVSLTIL